MTAINTSTSGNTAIAEAPVVRHFRQILFWPLQVMPADSNAAASSRYWDLFDLRHPESRWREVEKTFDEQTPPVTFSERKICTCDCSPMSRSAFATGAFARA